MFIMDVPTYPKPLAVTDATINIFPDLETKVDIVQNATDMAEYQQAVADRLAAHNRALGNIEASYTRGWSELTPAQQRTALADRQRRIDAAVTDYRRDTTELARIRDQSLRAIDSELERLPGDIARQERLIATEQETLQRLQGP